MESVYNFVHRHYILAQIECAAQNNNLHLRLANFDLIEVPPSIGDCKLLKKLYLQRNKITYLPQEIKQLTNLKKLAVDFNNITTVQPVLWELYNLVELNLSQNPLKTLPIGIKSLINLEILYLNNCQLSELPTDICELESLDTLGLRENYLNSLPNDFNKLNIRWLTLKNNVLSYLPANFHLPNLIHLNITNNRFTTIPTEISHLKCLRYISLRGNNIMSIHESVFKQMRNGVKFILDQNPLSISENIRYSNYIVTGGISDYESDSDSEDWEESLNNSEIDLSSTDSENDHIIHVNVHSARYLIS